MPLKLPVWLKPMKDRIKSFKTKNGRKGEYKVVLSDRYEIINTCISKEPIKALRAKTQKDLLEVLGAAKLASLAAPQNGWGDMA